MTGRRATPDDVERLSRMAGLEIDPAYLPSVTHNLCVLLDQAALIVDMPIDPIVEPAPVFHP